VSDLVVTSRYQWTSGTVPNHLFIPLSSVQVNSATKSPNVFSTAQVYQQSGSRIRVKVSFNVHPSLSPPVYLHARFAPHPGRTLLYVADICFSMHDIVNLSGISGPRIPVPIRLLTCLERSELSGAFARKTAFQIPSADLFCN
jgi:hypothetical protein